jgi:NAD(P)-dependent dehydrogenase (short-subunit alcohol dehydrogenase family)
MSVEQFQRTLDVNLTGTFLLVKHFLQLQGLGQLRPPSIVIVGSTAGKFGEAGHADCTSILLSNVNSDAASKSALQYGFLLSLKNEIVRFHPRGRANVVAPGWVRYISW